MRWVCREPALQSQIRQKEKKINVEYQRRYMEPQKRAVMDLSAGKKERQRPIQNGCVDTEGEGVSGRNSASSADYTHE